MAQGSEDDREATGSIRGEDAIAGGRFARSWPLLVYAGAAALSLSIFRHALHGEFISDDLYYVVTNPYLVELSWANVAAILDPWGPSTLDTANYAPIHLLVHALQRRVFGDDVFGYHVVNVLVHALNAVLLVALFRSSRLPFVPALLGSTIFVVHPANVEAVAWINQIRTSAALSLSLGALLAHRRHPGFATLLFASGLLTKPSAACALPMAAAFTWARRGQAAGDLRHWLWLALWGAVLALFAIPEFTAFEYKGTFEVAAFADPWVHARTIAANGMRYLVMAATSYGVSAFHEPDPVSNSLDPWWLASLPAGALLAWRLIVTLRRRAEEAAYWVGAAAAFAPISQVFPFYFSMADRYLYFILPGLIGGALLLGIDLRDRLAAVRSWRAASLAMWRGGAVAILVLAMLFHARSIQRAKLWTSELPLLVDSAGQYPYGGTAHFVRACAAAQKGDVEGAMAHLRAATEKGYHRYRSFQTSPWLARVHGEPAFLDLMYGIAGRQLEREYAIDREVVTPARLGRMADAHHYRREYSEAEALLERAIRIGGPLRPMLLEKLMMVRAGRREQRRQRERESPEDSGPAQGAGAPASAPNLLLISVDTLRADHTSLYGYEHDTTPGLAELAREGALFSLVYAPTAVTAPSHATIFTGTYPATHGLVKNGLALESETRTLAEILSQRGYQTAAVVSAFVLDEKFGFAEGFSQYQDDFDPATATVTTDTWEGHRVPAGFDRRADDTTRRAMRWLWFDRDADRPFFLFVHYFDPHAPYSPPEALKKRFLPTAGARAGDRVLVEEIGDYDAEIAFADQEIARLLEELERQGLARDTLVVLTADHGEGLMEHGHWLHGLDVYEEGVRVPLVVRWPGVVAAGLRAAEPVELVDLAPTILDLLGVNREAEHFDGRSLAPFLRGEGTLDPERPVFLYRRPFAKGIVDGVHVAGEQYGVRLGDMKLIDHSEGRDELYDLKSDPEEKHNLHATAPEDAARLERILAEWKRGHVKPRASPAISPEDRRALEALGYTE